MVSSAGTGRTGREWYLDQGLTCGFYSGFVLYWCIDQSQAMTHGMFNLLWHSVMVLWDGLETVYYHIPSIEEGLHLLGLFDQVVIWLLQGFCSPPPWHTERIRVITCVLPYPIYKWITTQSFTPTWGISLQCFGRMSSVRTRLQWLIIDHR